jgi:phage shock protein A
MTSFLERLDDLIRGSLHRFVDRALENSSLALYDQDVRDMGRAVMHVEEAATDMYAAARANERRLERHQEDVERLERRVERFQSEGVAPTETRMMVAEAELEAKRGLVLDTQAQIERQQGQYETLKRQSVELRLREQVLQDTRPSMESLLVVARAHHSVARVEMTLQALRGLGGDPEVAMIADDIYRRFDEAQARQDMIGQAADLEIAVELEQAEVDDQLEQRRQRLGLEDDDASAPPPAAPDDASPAPPPDVPEPSSPE